MLHRSLIFLGFLVVTVFSAVGTTRDKGDAVLPYSRMVTAFGGDSVPQSCCAQIAACNVPEPTSCPPNTTQAQCLNGRQQTVQIQYSRNCQTPNPACPTCSCAQYQKDVNGRSYYCVAVFFCKWDDLSKVCSKDGPDINSCVPGFLSCADNCPIYPP